MAEGKNIGAIIQGVAALGGAIASGISNRRQNRNSRSHEIDMWNRQNAYNDPQAQMQRLKQAGLNPNMVYGQSSGAAAGNASSPNSPKFYATDFGGAGAGAGQAVNTYYDIEVKKAQTDNLKADNNVKVQEALLKAAQTQNTGAQTGKTTSETEILNSIKGYSGEAAKQALAKTNADIEATITDTQRKQALHSANMEQAMLNILKTEKGLKLTDAQIKSVLADLNLKEQEAQLAEQGIYKGDPLWMRYLIQHKDEAMKLLNKFKMPTFKLW